MACLQTATSTFIYLGSTLMIIYSCLPRGHHFFFFLNISALRPSEEWQLQRVGAWCTGIYTETPPTPPTKKKEGEVAVRER